MPLGRRIRAVRSALVVALVFASTEAAAQVCQERPKSPVVRLEATGVAEVFRVVPVRGAPGNGLARRAPIGDLNGDGRIDESLFFGELDPQGHWNRDCGNWGHCVQGVYLRCADGTLAEALAPDYQIGLEVGARVRVGSEHWTDLVAWDRFGADSDPEVMLKTVWRWNGLTYQRAGERVESRKRPAVDGQCPGTALPAVSPDGKTVALMHCRSEYDDSYRFELRIIDAAKGKVRRTLVVDEAGASGDHPVPAAERRRAAVTGNRILRRGRFSPMVQLIDPIARHTVRAIHGVGVDVSFDESKGIYRVSGAIGARGRLRGFSAAGWCCDPDGSAQATCTLPPVLSKVWVDEKRKVVVFESANGNGPDGCEKGPEYTVVRER